MSTSILAPILATKLYIPPPRSKIVHRPRLIEQLNEDLDRKVTLISATAGFGKTTLVSEWLATCARPAAWLSLDEGDNDPTRFLSYVVAALQTIAANFGAGVLAMLDSPQPPPTESILTALLNEITTIPNNFILVLDDYHLLEAKAVDDALTFLVEHLSPRMHLVIATREDPQLPLARLRVRGQLTEVRATDLRFTPAEAAAFLNQVMGLALSDQEISALESRTEGWIAGLQLAALSMRGRADIAGFIKAFAGDNRYIVDYLVAEVLQRQPERLRTFLLQTSILDRLSGPLCDAVTGQGESNLLLETLERGNLFVIPLDDKRQWFRYHHLFADLLYAHLVQEQPAHLPILHRRASEWYAENGFPAEAIRHALAAKDFERAAALIEMEWLAMDARFQATVWLGWARALPDELVRARPVLSTAYGWALLNDGELEAAEARLADAEWWLENSAESSKREEVPSTQMVVVDKEQLPTLPASIATARAYLAQASGDLPDTVRYGQRALDLLPEGDYLRRAQAASLLGLAQWGSGDLEAAYRTLAEAMAGFQKAGNLNFSLSVTSGLVDIRTVQGRLREAIKINSHSLQLAMAHGETLLRGTADLYLGLSDLYREQGELEIAIQHLLRGEELSKYAELPNWRFRLYRAQARFKEIEGDLAGAINLLEEAERVYFRSPVPDLRPLAALKTRVWLAQGQLSEAQRWVDEQSLSVDDQLSFLREFEHITLARVLFAGRAFHEAIRLLDRLEQAAEVGGRMGSLIEIKVLQALVHQAQGNIPPALTALSRALTLAELEGYVRVFVDEGLPMARLLSTAAAQGILPAYCGKLLAAFALVQVETQPRPRKADLPPLPPSHAQIEAMIEPLSARELEVLQLIAQGLSNNEIGERLFVALSTVKGHNRNIFGKLQVQSRTEAIARARQLGLL